MQYCESYLKKYYDDFKFFDMECSDARIRETNMRIKRCLRCFGLEACKMHPNFWLEGEDERKRENEALKKLEPVMIDSEI